MNILPGQLLLIIFLFLGQENDPVVQTFLIDGNEVRVTHQCDERFYGKYSGANGGYLMLNHDGTGEYLYDYYGYALPDCHSGMIRFKWGFLLDKKNQIVKFKRDYGYSYPVIYLSTGSTSFRGCRNPYLIDYLMLRPDGTIGVSSSDDWEKNH